MPRARQYAAQAEATSEGGRREYWAKPKQSGERNENNANKNLRFYEQNAIIAMKMKMNKSVNVNVNVNVTKTGTSFRMKLP